MTPYELPPPYLNDYASSSSLSDPPALLRRRTPIRFTTRSREMASLQVELDRLKYMSRQQAQTIDRLENIRCMLDFENTCLKARYLLLKTNYRELKKVLGMEFSEDEEEIIPTDEEER